MLMQVSIRYMKSCGVPKRLVGAKIAGRLVAPRAVERMLHDRQELDMREAHALRRSRPAAAASSR